MLKVEIKSRILADEGVPSKVTDLLRKCNPHTVASLRQCTTHSFEPTNHVVPSCSGTLLFVCHIPRLLQGIPPPHTFPKAASFVSRRSRSGRSTNSLPILPTTDTDRLNDRFRYGWLFSFAD